jgi:antitoxin (DNA-binding transcriptional repressor) of toxin-antitoxin stability system
VREWAILVRAVHRGHAVTIAVAGAVPAVLTGASSTGTHGTPVGRRSETVETATVLESSKAVGEICRSSWLLLLLVWKVAVETLAHIPKRCATVTK